MPKRQSQDLCDDEQMLSDESDRELTIVDHDQLPDRDDPQLLESGTEWVFEGDLRAVLHDHPAHEPAAPDVRRKGGGQVRSAARNGISCQSIVRIMIGEESELGDTRDKNS